MNPHDRSRVVTTSVVISLAVLAIIGVYRLLKRRNGVADKRGCKKNDEPSRRASGGDRQHHHDDTDSTRDSGSLSTTTADPPQDLVDGNVGALGSVDTSGQLSVRDAEVLVTMLSASTDSNVLEKVLTTIGNSAAFTTNQNTLREAGALPRLQSLLQAHNMALKVGQSVSYPAVVNGVISSINNMAVNEHNQSQLKECIPTLIDFASTEQADEAIQLASLQALTNLSVKPEYHEPYTKLIQQLYEYLDHGTVGIRLQAMKVLANLSSNIDMVPHLLAAKAPRCLFELLAPDLSADILVRWTSILANVMCIVQDTGLTAESLPPEYKAPSPETTHTALYGHNNVNKFKSKVFVLSRHSNPDVRHQASRIYGCLT